VRRLALWIGFVGWLLGPALVRASEGAGAVSVAALPAYRIEIEAEPLQRLTEHRERIREFDFLTAADRLWIPATFVHAGESYDVKLRLRGDLPVHWRGDVQSYRVKFVRRPFRGMKELSLIVPWDKHYAVEWLQNRVAEDLGLLAFPGRFVDVTLNGEPIGLYYESEHPTRAYLERQGRPASSIFTFGASWTLYFSKEYHHILFELPGSTSQPPIESVAQIKQRATYAKGDEDAARKQFAYLLEFYDLLTTRSVAEVAERAGYFLDLEKFARFVALQDFFGSIHGMALNDNTRLYLDPTSGKFEFIPWDTALWSVAERAQKRDVPVKALLEPENPAFQKLFLAIPELRVVRDEVLGKLVTKSGYYRRLLAEEHAKLVRLYPDDERLRVQSERHDTVLRENSRLLAEALALVSAPRAERAAAD